MFIEQCLEDVYEIRGLFHLLVILAVCLRKELVVLAGLAMNQSHCGCLLYS